jgi:hypothetical protein
MLKRCDFVVDFTVPSRICKEVTAVQGMRKTMKNLSMTTSVMAKTQARHIPQGEIYILTAVFWDVMLSSWVSSPWVFSRHWDCMKCQEVLTL